MTSEIVEPAEDEGVKVLSAKSNNSNEKCSETISNYRVINDQDGFVAESLFHEFSDLLSNTGTSSKINLIGGNKK